MSVRVLLISTFVLSCTGSVGGGALTGGDTEAGGGSGSEPEPDPNPVFREPGPPSDGEPEEPSGGAPEEPQEPEEPQVIVPPSPAEMLIAVNYADGTPAPAAVWFEAGITGDTGLPARVNGDVSPNAVYDDYDQQFHELEFEWSFGDTGVWNLASRLPNQLQQRDYSHGKVTAHVFSTPGDKTVTCSAYRMELDDEQQLTRTLVASKTITFAVNGDYPPIPSLEDAIPLNRRVYFDPDGDYADAPEGATTGASLSQNTLSAAFTWAQARAPQSAAVLIRRGKSVAWLSGRRPNNENPNLYIGAYGTGPRPVVSSPNGTGLFTTKATQWAGNDRSGFFILDGIEVVGAWDPSMEEGVGNGAAFGGEAISHHLAHDCVFRNFGGPVVSFQLNSPQDAEVNERSLVLADTEILGWRDYGLMVRGNSKRAFRQDVAVIGSRIGQAPNAAHGINNKDGDQNAHGPIRTANVRHFVVRASDLYSRTHWDTKVQACIRADMNSAQQWGETPGLTVIYGNVLEGGASQILSSGAGGTTNPGGAQLCPPGATAGETECRAHVWPKNTLIKHNMLVGAFNVEQAVAVNRSAMSIIENVALRPNVEQWVANGDTTRGRDWIVNARVVDNIANSNGWVAGMNDELVRNPVRVIGNLTIDLKTTTDPADERSIENIVSVSTTYEGFVEVRDNTLYAPNYTTRPVESSGPFNFLRFITPREVYGVRHDASVTLSALSPSMTDNIANNNVFDEDPQFATPADGLRLLVPDATAGVVRSASGPMSHRDFLGVPRQFGSRPSSGAIEP